MSLGQMDPALVCSGPMSNLSYDSHIVTRSACHQPTPSSWAITHGCYTKLRWKAQWFSGRERVHVFLRAQDPV